MKNLKAIFLIIALCLSSASNAQFFKKLKKRAEKAAKEAISRKVEEKTEKETEKVFDTIFNNDGKFLKGKNAKVAKSYAFSHQYIMKIISDKNTTDITYYLTNKNEYMGTSFVTGENQKFITVMDLPNATIHTFMDLGGKKMRSSIGVDINNIEGDIDKKGMDASNFDIKPTGRTKKIVGYHCKEFQVTGNKLSGRVWVTKEADISFLKAFGQLKSKKMKRAKGINQSWMSMTDGLVLEMNMIDSSKRKPKSIKMLCTSLIKNDFTINTSAYQKAF